MQKPEFFQKVFPASRRGWWRRTQRGSRSKLSLSSELADAHMAATSVPLTLSCSCCLFFFPPPSRSAHLNPIVRRLWPLAAAAATACQARRTVPLTCWPPTNNVNITLLPRVRVAMPTRTVSRHVDEAHRLAYTWPREDKRKHSGRGRKCTNLGSKPPFL